MARIVLGIVAVIASFVLADSLSCNKCSFGVFGFCLNSAQTTCTTNTSSCFTGKATFPTVSSFSGFNSQGCLENSGCNQTINGTLLGATYQVLTSCCSSDKCNPVTLNGAPSAKLSLTVALGAAVMASALSSVWF